MKQCKKEQPMAMIKCICSLLYRATHGEYKKRLTRSSFVSVVARVFSVLFSSPKRRNVAGVQLQLLSDVAAMRYNIVVAGGNTCLR